MKDYRVTYLNGKTSRRTYRDFKTLEGAKKFIDTIGRDDCLLAKYNQGTFQFDPVNWIE